MPKWLTTELTKHQWEGKEQDSFTLLRTWNILARLYVEYHTHNVFCNCRADGLQPKTLETFRQLRLADPLLQRGVRVYDISFWRSTQEEPLHRLGREIHYPPVIDVLDPYILLVHQGIVEGLFIDDLAKRGKTVRRNAAFESFENIPKTGQLKVNCRTNVTQDKKTYITQYLVGCMFFCFSTALYFRANNVYR